MLLHLCLAVVAAGPPPADLVVTNARIFSDGLPAFAESLAVRDGRFVAVGEIRTDLVGPGTQRVDAGGRLVVPGLIDAHVHMLSGGMGLTRLQLRDVAGREEFIERVEARARRLEPRQWILGGRWSTESWTVPESPRRQWVDEVSGGRPLFLPRMDGHSALANTMALELAGITAHGPPDPAGGVIDRDPHTGAPTGILRESAMGLVTRHIPAPSVSDQVSALRAAVREALRFGITAVGDIADLEDLPAYERLAAEDPGIRFHLYLTADNWSEAARRAKDFRGRPGWVEIRGLKGYVDGSLGSRTAYMREPYLGTTPGGTPPRGLLREGVAEGRLAENIAAARRQGLQPIVHAIGDEANHHLLEILLDTYGDPAAARARSEHAQHLLPADIARFGTLGVIASMQPFHKADDGRYAESYIGPQRARSSYAFKSLLDAGAVVAFGSDWPVVTLNPFSGMEAAVTGRILDGSHWQTQENITVAEALRCYTTRGAYAIFAEHEIGRIGLGFRADFVILEGSPFAPDADWSAIRPRAVFVEGRRAETR